MKQVTIIIIFIVLNHTCHAMNKQNASPEQLQTWVNNQDWEIITQSVATTGQYIVFPDALCQYTSVDFEKKNAVGLTMVEVLVQYTSDFKQIAEDQTSQEPIKKNSVIAADRLTNCIILLMQNKKITNYPTFRSLTNTNRQACVRLYNQIAATHMPFQLHYKIGACAATLCAFVCLLICTFNNGYTKTEANDAHSTEEKNANS